MTAVPVYRKRHGTRTENQGVPYHREVSIYAISYAWITWLNRVVSYIYVSRELTNNTFNTLRDIVASDDGVGTVSNWGSLKGAKSVYRETANQTIRNNRLSNVIQHINLSLELFLLTAAILHMFHFLWFIKDIHIMKFNILEWFLIIGDWRLHLRDTQKFQRVYKSI